MYIDQIGVGSEVSIEAWIGSKKIEVKSEVIDMDPQLRELLAKKAKILPIKVLEEDDKVVTFPAGIVYKIYISHEGTPFLWTEVAIKLIHHPKTGEKMHLIVSNQDAKQYNRREYYRLFLGYDGVAQIGANHKAFKVLVKDISATGVGFILDKNDMITVSIGDEVHLKFEDSFTNTKFDMITRIVRIVDEEEDNRALMGCQQEKYSESLNKYVTVKQREKSKSQRAC